jgi:uroporphyrinogen-III synthase
MRVLVLRPQEDADRTARKLAARGHEAFVAPVLAIRQTGEAPPPGPFSAAILTSANAVPALASVHWERDVPVFTVGARTAATANAAGFKNVRTAEGDAAALSALVGASVPAGGRLLHAAGRERKPEPDASLTEAGFTVSTWIAYEAVAAERLPPAAEDALREERLDAALHYSRRSAGVALDLAGVAGVAAPFLALAHICLSEDAAAPLRSGGATCLSIAERPDEEALLEALDRCAREPGETGSRNRSAQW